MNKPLVTLIRESLVERLRQSEVLARIVDDRIFLNRFEAWDEGELSAVGVYALREEPIASNLNPSPDERKLTFSVDLLTREDADTEERLDVMASEVETFYTLDPLGELIKAKGGPDTLLKIEWLDSERGFVPEAERTLGVNVMTFALEYQLPAERPTLDDFRQAHTDWKAESAEGELVAEDLLNLPGWD